MKKELVIIGLILLSVSGIVSSLSYCEQTNPNINFTKDGDLSLKLTATVKGGNIINFNILYSNETIFLGTGRSSDERLAVSDSNTLTFHKRDSNGNNYHEYFVVTSSQTKESYLLRAQVSQDISAGRNETTIQKYNANNWVTACTERTVGDYCNIGNVELLIGDVYYISGGKESVVINAGSNVVFDKIYDINGNNYVLPKDEDVAPTPYIGQGILPISIYDSDSKIVGSYIVYVSNNVLNLEDTCGYVEDEHFTIGSGACQEELYFDALGAGLKIKKVGTDEDFPVIEEDKWFGLTVKLQSPLEGYEFNYYVMGPKQTLKLTSQASSCSLGCTENWTCTSWSTCTNNQQTRTCTDSNSCGTTENKPLVGLVCIPGQCTEDWHCEDWGSCIDGKQTRTCTDSNSCGTTVNKPSLSKDCTTQTLEQNQQEEQQSDKLKIPNEGTFVLNGKEVIVNRNENGEISIDFGEEGIVDIEGSLDLIKDKLGAYIMTSMGNTKIEISAEDAIMKSTKMNEVEKVVIEEYKTLAVYSVYGTKDTQLFFVIPKKAQVVQKISVENGKLLDTELPWWRFFALGV